MAYHIYTSDSGTKLFDKISFKMINDTADGHIFYEIVMRIPTQVATLAEDDDGDGDIFHGILDVRIWSGQCFIDTEALHRNRRGKLK